MKLSWGITLAAVVYVAVVPAAAYAGPAAVHPGYVETGVGTVTMTRTVDPSNGDVDYTVVLVGRIGAHGWTYTGSMSGASIAPGQSFTAEYTADIPGFTVRSTGSVVTGTCSGSSSLGENVSPNVSADTTFNCLLSRNGATPWLVVLDAALAPTSSVGNATTWRGTYVASSPSRWVVQAGPGSYGDVQVQQFIGAGFSYTVQLSGQVVVGSSTYVGDVVSTQSAWVYPPDNWDIPVVDVSGSNAAHHLAGQCRGLATSNLVGSPFDWDLQCQLSLDGGPVTAVLLSTTSDGGGAILGPSEDDPVDNVTTGFFADS